MKTIFPNLIELLQGLADGLKEISPDAKHGTTEAVFFDEDGDEVLCTSPGLALDYLVNDVHRDGETDWKLAVRVEVRTF